MSKRQLIDEIRSVNRTALPEFLARFDEVDLNDYLQHLIRSQAPRLQGKSARYGQYVSAYNRPMDVTARTAATATLTPATTTLATEPPARTPAWRDDTELPEPADFRMAFDDEDEEWIDDLDAFSPPAVNKALTLTATTTTPGIKTTDKWLF